MKFCGNDTIDCYPSLERGIKKILVVNEQKFQEIQKEFKAFFKGVRGQSGQRSLNLGAARGQNLKPKLLSQGFTPKLIPESPGRHQNYEPTNAIYCNTSDWRRWIRVREWFSQYAQAEESQEIILIQ